ncbi:MAG: ATPase, T2SS/T4P/T4SS family [Proteobacteria bacterium]|nr:ATPase, T2SS/T4P/T4SS family [Pseudomonadota bacterium]
MSQNIYAFLLANAQVSKEDIFKAKKWAEEKDVSLGYALEKLKILSPRKILKLFSQFYKIKLAFLEKVSIAPDVLTVIPTHMAKKNRILPLSKSGNSLTIAIADPSNIQAVETVRFHTGCFIHQVFVLESDLMEAYERFYAKGKIDVSSQSLQKMRQSPKFGKAKRIVVSDQSSGDGPVIKLVNDIILSCISHKASDIHVEAYEKSLRIRLRTDGLLYEIAQPPLHIKDALISRIKIMSELDIAETRLPQDGALKIETDDREVAFRVSTVPCINGEKIVMRILDNAQLDSDISSLGFEPKQFEMFERVLDYSNGVILVTGPTGSGKTTTLYSVLSRLNNEEVNVVTAEDPVEFVVPNVNQVAVKPSIGFDFAAALRAFLRQDPDVIMVGEIRDLETADIAMKAALTGHIVLSTLHTNSAPDTISRLLNMGVAPFNLTAALRCVVAQRLMRRICVHCKTVDKSITHEQLYDAGVPKRYLSRIKTYVGKGCNKCSGSGYSGRIAIYEIMVINEEIKQMILARNSSAELKAAGMRNGMKTLRQSAITKMAQGISTLYEVIRVTDADARSKKAFDPKSVKKYGNQSSDKTNYTKVG